MWENMSLSFSKNSATNINASRIAMEQIGADIRYDQGDGSRRLFKAYAAVK